VLFIVPLVLVLLVVARSLLRRNPLPRVLTAAVVVTGFATILASRNIVWFGMAAALLFADLARTWLPTQQPTRRFLTVMTGSSVAIAALGVGTLLARSNGSYETLTPLRAISAAADYAAQHPCVAILGDNVASSALLWHDPQLAGRVAYDARLERYKPAALDRWINFQRAQGPQWPQTTNGYQLLIASATYDPALVHRLTQLQSAVDLEHDGSGIAVVNGPVGRC
jgi:hypothetical protein